MDYILEDHLKTQNQIFATLKHNLTVAQKKIPSWQGANWEGIWIRGFRPFELQSYNQKSMGLCNHLKLSAQFFGPFKIIQRIGKGAYILELPQDSHIHPTPKYASASVGKTLPPHPSYLLLIKMVSFPRNPREICNEGVRSCRIDLSPKYVSSGKASKKKLLGPIFLGKLHPASMHMSAPWVVKLEIRLKLIQVLNLIEHICKG